MITFEFFGTLVLAICYRPVGTAVAEEAEEVGRPDSCGESVGAKALAAHPQGTFAERQ